MPGERHSQQHRGDGLHPVVAFEYPTAVDRLADTNRAPTVDPSGKALTLAIGHLARQIDDGEVYECVSLGPLAWKQWTGIGALAKSGILIPGDFSGNPKVAAVTFATPYPDTSYVVLLGYETTNNKSFAVRAESKTPSGFDVSLGANNIANLVEVAWHTTDLADP